MRNLRVRRRFSLFLILILTGSIVLFVEDRIEAFVPEMKDFAEARIEAALGGRARFSIGDIGGGLIHPLALNDIKIQSAGGETLLPSLQVSSIKTSYRIWDLFRAIYTADVKGEQGVGKFLSGVSGVDINFITPNKDLSGFLRIENKPGELKAIGYISRLAGGRIDFSGRLKDGIYSIEVRTGKGIIKAGGSFSQTDKALNTKFKIYHLDIGGYDLVCDGLVKTEFFYPIESGEKSFARGAVEINNCILNYKPFLNLKADYKISDGNLEITGLSLSDIFKGSGTFQMKDPYDTNFALAINNLSLNWLSLALNPKEGPSVLTGTMNGKCVLKGPMAKLRSNFEAEVRKGAIGGLEFEFLSAHFKGEGPIIRIEDSRITRESGYFVLAGELDLRRIGKDNMFQSVRLVGDDKAVNWDGWNTSKVQNVSEVSMRKKLNDDVGLDFKTFISNNTVDENLTYADEVQLEYRLNPNESLKMTVGQDKDFLGIEHKNKF